MGLHFLIQLPGATFIQLRTPRLLPFARPPHTPRRELIRKAKAALCCAAHNCAQLRCAAHNCA